jgi:hypothetical protein
MGFTVRTPAIGNPSNHEPFLPKPVPTTYNPRMTTPPPPRRYCSPIMLHQLRPNREEDIDPDQIKAEDSDSSRQEIQNAPGRRQRFLRRPFNDGLCRAPLRRHGDIADRALRDVLSRDLRRWVRSTRLSGSGRIPRYRASMLVYWAELLDRLYACHLDVLWNIDQPHSPTVGRCNFMIQKATVLKCCCCCWICRPKRWLSMLLFMMIFHARRYRGLLTLLSNGLLTVDGC